MDAIDRLSKMSWNARVEGLMELAKAAGYTSITCTPACGKMLELAEDFADWYTARVFDYLSGDTADGVCGVGLYPFPTEHLHDKPDPWDCLIVYGVKGKAIRCWVGAEIMERILTEDTDGGAGHANN